MIRALGIDPGPKKSYWAQITVMHPGAPYLLDGCGVVESESLEGCCNEFADLLFFVRPDIVAIETIARRWVRPGQAMEIASTAQIAGALFATAFHVSKAISAHVVAAPAPIWRVQLMGKTNPTDGEIREFIASLTTKSPGVIRHNNAHVRDAMGVAIHAAGARHGT